MLLSYVGGLIGCGVFLCLEYCWWSDFIEYCDWFGVVR